MSSSTLHGNGVVPGIGIGPVVRPMPRPVLPQDEEAVDAEAGAARFGEAATLVADRLAARAGHASGAAAEVLMATSSLARDRGLVALVQKRLGEVLGICAATAGAI
jgi:phosphoenolpyruvate-protein phosphotransferase (PTS system enzyme I)